MKKISDRTLGPGFSWRAAIRLSRPVERTLFAQRSKESRFGHDADQMLNSTEKFDIETDLGKGAFLRGFRVTNPTGLQRDWTPFKFGEVSIELGPGNDSGADPVSFKELVIQSQETSMEFLQNGDSKPPDPEMTNRFSPAPSLRKQANPRKRAEVFSFEPFTCAGLAPFRSGRLCSRRSSRFRICRPFHLTDIGKKDNGARPWKSRLRPFAGRPQGRAETRCKGHRSMLEPAERCKAIAAQWTESTGKPVMSRAALEGTQTSGSGYPECR